MSPSTATAKGDYATNSLQRLGALAGIVAVLADLGSAAIGGRDEG